MMAPIFGANFVPPRVRFLAGAITLIVAPLVPRRCRSVLAAAVVAPSSRSSSALLPAFALQLIFDALAMGGQLLSNTMGLGFAFNVDPLRGVSTPVLGQLYMIMVTLTFLAINGHLVLIEILAQGFTTLPVGMSGLDSGMIWRVVEWGSQLFAGALAVALPGMAALLVVNLAFGVMSRAAPTLNLFAVGFPITLIAGLVIMYVGLPSVLAAFGQSLEAAFGVIRTLLNMSP